MTLIEIVAQLAQSDPVYGPAAPTALSRRSSDLISICVLCGSKTTKGHFAVVHSLDCVWIQARQIIQDLRRDSGN